MPLIKRYPNRKLYDTEAKRYITLDGIAALIRKGKEVTIIDHKTDEDLTAVTLTQIIFEQEKKQSGFLPTSVLTGLVRTGGDTLNSLRRGLAAPLDIFKQVDSEIDRRFQLLISKGELAREEGIRLRDRLLSISSHPADESIADEEQDPTLDQEDIPTREEIDHLHHQIQNLNVQLDTLLQESARKSAEKESAPAETEQDQTTT
jgi:polyhydroxyalkanoate synthesis repressor PhaR